ncbi:bifunctional 2-polyprenyl-6-hydroxyphenol methylase/3-demethylubiquinol 3-O-methyltransferase UbiG [Kiloniella laminariae]|uniref:bifunctional 2-polyprenyl-6-hydroxyphenol methylase/3-demethylubiquinol 3-O-methyltransferase UbiG n=1 Tax=Kiloniella laminariae TaxID=454162 RepID=UPI00035E6351
MTMAKKIETTQELPLQDDAAGITVDPQEISKFAAMAEEWWDPLGKFKPLHQLNPVRICYIRDHLAKRHNRDITRNLPLEGLTILDIGCGGGLLSEPLTRLGAQVTSIDASHRNIEIARLHAEETGLVMDYRHMTAEDLVETGARFDAVINMEVIEHVADVEAYSSSCAALVKPGGVMFGSTLNRTTKSYLLAIVGAEYLLRWVPRGTHEWNKFLRPSEFVDLLRRNGLVTQDIMGMVYNPLRDKWFQDAKDLDVNYMLVAEKPL